MSKSASNPPPRRRARTRQYVVEDFDSDARLELRIRGSDTISEVEATVRFDDGWEMTETFVRVTGGWVASGQPQLRHREDAAREVPARVRRRTVDRFVPEINALLDAALDIDDRLHERPEWRDDIAREWGLTTIRSRRGGKQIIDLDDVNRRLAQGDPLFRIAADLHVSPQSLRNARSRARRRKFDD